MPRPTRLTSHFQAIASASLKRNESDNALVAFAQLVDRKVERLPCAPEIPPEPLEAIVTGVDGIQAREGA